MADFSTASALAAALALLVAIGTIVIMRLRRQIARAEAARRLAEAKLEIVEFVAEVGTWEVDGATKAVDWSEQVFAIHNRNPAKGPPPLADAIGYYHPDDRMMVSEAVECALAEGDDFEFHARIVDESGRLRHVLSRGAARFCDGKIAGLFGSFIEMRGGWERAPDSRALAEQLI